MLQGVLYDRAALAALAERMTETVDLHHQRAPLEDGLSIQALRALAGGSPIVDRMLQRLVAAGRLLVARGLASRPGWAVRPSPVQESAMERLAAAIRGAGREPPSTSELATSGMVGVSDPDEIATLLRVLERRGIVRQVELDRYYSIEALDGLRTALRTGMSPGREYGPAELRDLLGVSRKYLIPLLEHCDRVGLTERRTGGRVRADGRPAPRGPKGAEEIPDEAASSPAEAAGTE